MTALQPGDPQRVGPYVLLGRLGSGGMGRVYLARSPGGRMVAVKVIRANLAEDTGFRARFAREVSAARKVGGLFTAQVVDADIDGPVPWLVTAYVAGTSLSDAVERQGPLPQNSVLALAAGLAEGLIAIHAAGVIHRDLKPSNVLLAQDGPRIIDFGISSAAEATQLTGTGFMIGSPGFMSPEQAEGLTVGPASDIFSLAGVLIYAARGEGPFGTGDTAALLYRVVHGKPTIDKVPDNLRPLIKRSLSRDPKRRPTATQFLADLSAAYPAAADLANWLPARILDLAPTGFGPAEGRLYPSAASGASLAGGSVAAGSLAGGSVADRYDPAMADPVAPMADPVAPMPVAADALEAEAPAGTSVDPPTRTSLSSQTPPPPTAVPAQGYPGQQQYPGQQGYSGPQGYSDPQGYSGQHSGQQAYSGPQAYQGQQQYLEPQGYRTGQGDPAAPGGFTAGTAQGTQGNSWWSGQQTGGMPQSAPPAQGGPGMPEADQWHGPPAGPTPPRKRPRWLIPAVAAAAGIVIVVVALVLVLSPGSHKTGAQQPPSPTPTGGHTASPTASPTPTVGNLLVSQFQVGDCLTGANLGLDTTAPFPKLSQAVPCSQGHLAEVFYANNNFWAKGGSYPGEIAISNAARTQCNSAFQSYVGIPEWNSIYRSLPIAPSAATWSAGERGLHCIAYYATPSQPAGVTLHGSIKGTNK